MITRGRITASVALAIILVILLSVLRGAPSARAGMDAGRTLTIGFEATVDQGPDRGLALRGTLHLTHYRGRRVAGTLSPARGAAIAVMGQQTGVAVNLVFLVQKSHLIFGEGTLVPAPQSRRWVMGGGLVGPRKGDSGSWQSASTPGNTLQDWAAYNNAGDPPPPSQW
jgi:hypothetical protein